MTDIGRKQQELEFNSGINSTAPLESTDSSSAPHEVKKPGVFLHQAACLQGAPSDSTSRSNTQQFIPTSPPKRVNSPSRILTQNRGSNPGSLETKATNFHNIADLIGEREQQFKDETQAPESTRNVANPVSGQSEPSENNEEQPSASGEDSVKRARKGRTIYKAQQVYVLEEIFWRTHYPDPEVIETLARDLEISENKIKVWFQNKRARWRRRTVETEHPLIPTAGFNPLAPPAELAAWRPMAPVATFPAHPFAHPGLLVPRPVYPGLQGPHCLPVPSSPAPIAMFPQLQSLCSVNPNYIASKSGHDDFSSHFPGIPKMQLRTTSSKSVDNLS